MVRSLAAGTKSTRFDAPIVLHIERFISDDLTHADVGSLTLSLSWNRQYGVIIFLIQLVLSS